MRRKGEREAEEGWGGRVGKEGGGEDWEGGGGRMGREGGREGRDGEGGIGIERRREMTPLLCGFIWLHGGCLLDNNVVADGLLSSGSRQCRLYSNKTSRSHSVTPHYRT